MPRDEVAECVFCQKFGNALLLPPVKLEWFDKILAQTENFVAVAGIGAFSPGYMMVVTKAHLNSMASIPNAWRDEFMAFAAQVEAAINHMYGPVTVFEHATQEPDTHGGSCIDHAHLHLCPRVEGVGAKFRSAFDVIEVEGFLEARQRSGGKSYVYLAEPGQRPFIAILTAPLPSQMMRRLIAAQMGIPNQWDWAVFPNLDNVRATIEDVGEVLSKKN